ncbi:MAG: ATP-binding protein, partial [Deltaproteobacteria bacterium]|nr:ATP-binding protein [Deltaproteobacteria bacterium]
LIGFFRVITQRKQAEEALRKSKTFNENILNSMNEALAIIDVQDFRVVQANMAFFDLVGMEEEKVIGKKCYEITHDQTTPCDSQDHICPISETLKTGNPSTAEHVHYTKDGAKINVEVSSSPIRNEKGEIVQVVHLERNITEKRNLESQLSQAQKLEAIGQLAAGIAHEINTPTQYIGDNTKFFQDSFKDVSLLLDQYGSLLRALKESHPPDALIREVEATAGKIDLPYLSREIPRAIEQTLEGVNRVANIVRAMKEFSHPGTKEKTPIQINRAIENALTVSHNEWKYVAEVVTDLDPSLPPVPCLPQEFNQAILNIIINAAHAIADALGQPPSDKGTITISTRRAGDWAEIRIRDTGTGIPAEIQSKVFEPFFTTKKVGKGTGQGLAIAYAFIVKKQGGTIHFETEVGKGTTFIIRLPLSAQTESLSPAGSPEGKAA